MSRGGVILVPLRQPGVEGPSRKLLLTGPREWVIRIPEPRRLMFFPCFALLFLLRNSKHIPADPELALAPQIRLVAVRRGWAHNK